jgi:hypothetical protein
LQYNIEERENDERDTTQKTQERVEDKRGRGEWMGGKAVEQKKMCE